MRSNRQQPPGPAAGHYGAARAGRGGGGGQPAGAMGPGGGRVCAGPGGGERGRGAIARANVPCKKRGVQMRRSGKSKIVLSLDSHWELNHANYTPNANNFFLLLLVLFFCPVLPASNHLFHAWALELSVAPAPCPRRVVQALLPQLVRAPEHRPDLLLRWLAGAPVYVSRERWQTADQAPTRVCDDDALSKVYTHTYIYIYPHEHTHIHTHMNINTYIYPHEHTYTYTYTCKRTHAPPARAALPVHEEDVADHAVVHAQGLADLLLRGRLHG